MSRRTAGPVLLVLLAAACGAGAGPVPRPGLPAAGCYVVERRVHLTADSLELLFPFFFALDPASPTGRVRLPADELVGRAGTWSWSERDSLVSVDAVTPEAGFHLTLRLADSTWDGLLRARSADTTGEWIMSGRRLPCPEGLVPAGL